MGTEGKGFFQSEIRDEQSEVADVFNCLQRRSTSSSAAFPAAEGCWCVNPFSHPHSRESVPASSAFAKLSRAAGKDSRTGGDEMGISSQHSQHCFAGSNKSAQRKAP